LDALTLKFNYIIYRFNKVDKYLIKLLEKIGLIPLPPD